MHGAVCRIEENWQFWHQFLTWPHGHKLQNFDARQGWLEAAITMHSHPNRSTLDINLTFSKKPQIYFETGSSTYEVDHETTKKNLCVYKRSSQGRNSNKLLQLVWTPRARWEGKHSPMRKIKNMHTSEQLQILVHNQFSTTRILTRWTPKATKQTLLTFTQHSLTNGVPLEIDELCITRMYDY